MERRRRIATYVIVFGLLCAGAKLAVGRFEWWRAGRRLEALVTKCKESPPNYLTDKDMEEKGEWVPVREDRCDGEAIHSWVELNSHPLPGIGGEIEQAFSRREEGWRDTLQVALIIVIAFSLPRAWYSLLGRIGELSAVIRGPRP
jgi:hypothetical protein